MVTIIVLLWLQIQVMIVDYEGASRAVAIGRLKVEARPMIMVEFESETSNGLIRYTLAGFNRVLFC